MRLWTNGDGDASARVPSWRSLKLLSIAALTLTAAILCVAAAMPAPAHAAEADAYEPDSSYLLATPLLLGDAPQQHSLYPEGDEDWFSIPVQAGVAYAIETAAGAVPDDPNTELRLYDSDGTTLLDENTDHYSRLVFAANEDETLYAKVDGWYMGTYAISTSIVSDFYEPDSSCLQARPFTVGTTLQQYSIIPDYDEDWISFPMEAGWRYLIETAPGATSEDPDTVLALYDSDGTSRIDIDDDGGTGTFSRIEHEATTTRTVYAKVSAWSAGTYALSVTRTPIIKIGLTPSSLDFGEVAVGESLQRTLVVENQGVGPLVVGTIDLAGTGFSIVRDEAGGTTIPVGESREIDVLYTPTDAYTGAPKAVAHDWGNLLFEYVYSNGFILGYRLYSGFQNEGGAGSLEWSVSVAGTPATGSGSVVAGGRYNVRVSVSHGGASGLVELLTPVADSWDFQNTLGGLSGVTYVRVPEALLTITSNDDDEPTIDVGVFGVAVPDGPADATITTTSPSVTLAKYGAAYNVTGALTSGSDGVPGKTVVLQRSSSESGPFTTTSVTAVTAADGSFSLPCKPAIKTWYRPRFAGDADYEAATGGIISVLPRAYVGNPIAPTVMYAYTAKAVYGYLKPRHTAGTYPVRIYKYRYVSGKWKSYGYVKAKATNYSSYTKYSGSVKLAYRGRWRLRAYNLADAGHEANWSSGYDYVTVK